MINNLPKHEAYGKKRYFTNGKKAELVHRWLGPRGRNLSGTAKGLARLAWDKQRRKPV